MTKKMLVAIVDQYKQGVDTLSEGDFNVMIAREAGLEPFLVKISRDEHQRTSLSTKDVVELVLATDASYAIIRGFLWLRDGEYAGCNVANMLQRMLHGGVVCTGTSDPKRHPLVPPVNWDCPPERAAEMLLNSRSKIMAVQLERQRDAVKCAEEALAQARACLEDWEKIAL